MRPGHWIVEGFASFVQEFVFDDATDTARTLAPTARRLEIVARAQRTR